MGMDLSVKYKILTVEEYEKMEREELYFSNEYDLELIDECEAKNIINSQYLQIFEEYINNHPKSVTDGLKDMLNEIEEPFSMKFFVNDYLGVTLEEAPITLEQYLDLDRDYYSVNFINKEKIEDNEFYILVSAKYW